MRQLFWRSAAAKRWAGKAKLDAEQPGTRFANVVATGTRQMQEPLTARSDSADDALLGQGEASGGLAAAHIPTARNDEVPGDDERGAWSVPSVTSTPKTLAGLEILDLSEIEAHQTGKKPHANQDVTVSPSSSSPVSASSRASSSKPGGKTSSPPLPGTSTPGTAMATLPPSLPHCFPVSQLAGSSSSSGFRTGHFSHFSQIRDPAERFG